MSHETVADKRKQTFDLKRRFQARREAIKTLVSALVALSVLAGIAGPVAAADAKTFYEQMERSRY